MPIAAVPTYLGADFQHASPGMRFGMYLKLWEGFAWAKVKNKPLDDAKSLNDNDKKTMAALCTRQQQSFNAIASADASLRLDAESVAPFTTGLGNEHPLENGFAFLNPYGLPYLPGSGVKGVLRQAARELASGDWGDARGWSEDKRYTLMEGEDKERRPVLDKNKQPVMLSMADVLFGLASGDSFHLRGALIFWDVIPQIAPEDPKKPDQISLAVDIMTPHQSHYYQGKAHAGSASPHDSGQPNPISFLTVPPGSGFAFHVVCDSAHLRRLAPELVEDGNDGAPVWKTLLTAAFEHAFEWLGFGAKTTVGYGAMITPAQQKARAERAKERLAKHQAAVREQNEIRQQQQAQPWPEARIKFDRRNGALTVEKGRDTAIAIAPKGEELLNTLPPEIKQKVLANQFVRVTAYVSEGVLVRVASP